MKIDTYPWMLMVVATFCVFALESARAVDGDNFMERYVLAENLKAVPQESAEGLAVEAKIGEFAIVEKTAEALSIQRLSAEHGRQEKLVVRDQVVGDYGLSDGTFFVFYRDAEYIDEIVHDHGLVVKDHFVNARMVRVFASESQDVFLLMQQVRQDPRVLDVELNTTFDRLEPM